MSIALGHRHIGDLESIMPLEGRRAPAGDGVQVDGRAGSFLVARSLIAAVGPWRRTPRRRQLCAGGDANTPR
ncbi:hypothetical protein [Micromonospora sp. WMMD736]|uniref:hypothetical protein n=1 Tax=Micromonospora sp. WMMD736 TaxID=3404112 RepID=UPI003B956220